MPLAPKNKAAREIGHIIAYFSGVAKIQGLPRVFLHEILTDSGDSPVALVIGFDSQQVEALFFDENFDINKPVFRSRRKFYVSASEFVCGRVLNGFGLPRDGLRPISGKDCAVFREAPPIIDRDPVSAPLTTGVKVIDSVLCLGRGQRELIIGDIKLGKSTLALDSILNQKNAEPPVFCIYVLCGQKEQKLRHVVSLLQKSNALQYTVVVAATAGDSYAAQYLAPFVGCAIGEYFRDRKKDALIIYDDLTRHAKAYRSISLLLSRPPGRESYPGDIFSLHAGLLERAAKLNKEKGAGSLTALPIVETEEGDITSFIPTNLISITDGQIYFERGLFQKGFLPAVNVGLSVSRVGSQAQPAPLQQVVGGIRLTLSQHKELQKLTQLETAVSEQSKNKINRGDLTLELLKQEKHTYISWPEQAVLFFLVENGFFDSIKKEEWNGFENLLLQLIKNNYQTLLDKIKREGLSKTVESDIKEIASVATKEFLS